MNKRIAVSTIIALCISLCMTGVSLVQAASFTWSYAAEEQSNIKGFLIYQQEVGATQTYSYKIVSDARAFTLPVDRVEPGKTYQFWITAYNQYAESGKSDVVEYTPEGFIAQDNQPPVLITIPGKVGTITIEIEK